MRTRILLLLTCVVCAAGLVLSGSNLYALKQTPDRGEVIPQPDHYVSFEAVVTRTSDNGRTFKGRFYRRSDGSEALSEQGVNPATPLLHRISNYETGRYYRFTQDGEWISGPLLEATRFTGTPLVFRTKSLPSFQKYKRKLGLLAGQDGSLLATEGIEAWVNATQSGSIHLLAPDLNFYPVVSIGITGSRRVVSEIKVGPLPSSVFEPPAGANIKHVSTTHPPPPGTKRAPEAEP